MNTQLSSGLAFKSNECLQKISDSLQKLAPNAGIIMQINEQITRLGAFDMPKGR